MEEKATQTTTKERSRLYPRYHLEHAVEFVMKVDDLGGASVSKEAVAQATGKATNNSAFIGRISSARQFGLITLQGGKISITPIARRVLLQTSENDRRAALATAFSAPELYRELIDNYNGRTLPNKESLANVLVHDYGIKKNARVSAAYNFIHSAEWLDLIQNGILNVQIDGMSSDEGEEEAADEGVAEKIASPVGSPLPSSSNEDFYVFPYPGNMKLIIPKTKETVDEIQDGGLKPVKTALLLFAKTCQLQDESEMANGEDAK